MNYPSLGYIQATALGYCSWDGT